MTVTSPQAGPRLADLSATQPAEQTDALAMAPAPSGGVMSNDASMEAILTHPVQQARVQTELSKQRLERLALQLSQARHVL